MTAVTMSANGQYIYAALQEVIGGNVVIRRAPSGTYVWEESYNPGVNGSANVIACPQDDYMLFYGDFGGGTNVLLHTISTNSQVDISPVSGGVVAAAAVNGSSINNIAILTADSLLVTFDGGTIWEVWIDGLYTDATALAMLWAGNYFFNQFVVGDKQVAAQALLYSPNEGFNHSDYAGPLGALASNICNVDMVLRE